MKIKNVQAIDYSDRSEVENLFLDSIDEYKKLIMRKKIL